LWPFITLRYSFPCDLFHVAILTYITLSIAHTLYEHRVSSLDISEDASLLTAGFSDSYIRVYSLNGKPLREMREFDDPSTITGQRLECSSFYSLCHDCIPSLLLLLRIKQDVLSSFLQNHGVPFRIAC
jgi:hypothetical protein